MIHVYLTPSEHRHFADLFFGAGSFRIPDTISPAESRERKITVLESVIGMDRPRARIGADEVEVYGARAEAMARWQ